VQIKNGINITEINIIYKLDEVTPTRNIWKNVFIIKVIKVIKKTKIENILINNI
jgi:hypothetical protein